jgi:hypothetical protein
MEEHGHKLVNKMCEVIGFSAPSTLNLEFDTSYRKTRASQTNTIEMYISFES